ncbi:MAG: glycosyltransferase family 2 protein [Clostridia bacterium]|nr:glycosyltransferase family 2 protein [Clostridia bacterium]
MNGAPLVSVCVIVYNQAQYVRQALDSVFAQQTSFEYEVVVGDDCSTDATGSIVAEYAERYGSLRLITSGANTECKGIIEAVRAAARGEYLAWLEGDDFWLDSRKLEKQAEFLRAHPEYIGCTGEVCFVDEAGAPTVGFSFKRYSKRRRFTLEDAADGYLPGQTSSLMYRNVFRELDDNTTAAFRECDSIGDMKIAQFLTLFGDIYRLPEKLSAYRYLTTGESFSARTKGVNLSEAYLHWALERKRMAETVLGRNVSFYKTLRDICYHAWVEYLQHPNSDNLRVLRRVRKRVGRPLATGAYIAWRTLGYPFRRVAGAFGRTTVREENA